MNFVYAQTAVNSRTAASKDLEDRAIRFWKHVIASGAIDNCMDINLPIKKGTACATSKGFVWQRVEVGLNRGWKDIITGTIWFENGITSMHQRKAAKYCKEQGQYLPSGWPEDQNGKNGFPNFDSDFVSAIKHDIREVFLDKNDDWSWSSTVHPDFSDYAYGNNGRSGYVRYVRRDFSCIGSVRCVARQ